METVDSVIRTKIIQKNNRSTTCATSFQPESSSVAASSVLHAFLADDDRRRVDIFDADRLRTVPSLPPTADLLRQRHVEKQSKHDSDFIAIDFLVWKPLASIVVDLSHSGAM